MKIYNFLIPLLFFTVGLTNVGKDLFGFKMDHYPGDLVDSRFNNAILEHDYRWLRGWHTSLWDPPFFSPAKNTLAGSDSHLGTFVFYAAFRVIGFDPFSSFKAWIFALYLLNFFVCFYVLRKFGIGALGSSMGAFIFTFTMPVTGQLFHVQTLCKFPIPLVFLYLKKLLDAASIRNFIFLLLSFVWLVCSSMYFTLLVLPFMAIFTGIYLFHHRPSFKNVNRKTILWSLVAVAVSVVMLLPFIMHYAQSGSMSEPVSKEEVAKYLPGLISYITPVYGNVVWSELSLKLQTGYENAWILNFFPGLIPLVLLIGGFFYWKKRDVFARTGRLTFFIGILLFTGFGGYSLYLLLHALPGFEHLKVVGRFFLVALFFLAVSAAWTWEKFSAKKPLWILVLVPVLLVAEQWNVRGTCSYIPFEKASTHHLPLAEQIIKLRNEKPNAKVAVYLKNADSLPDNIRQVDAMWAGLETKIPVINGYTTAIPPSFDLISNRGDYAAVKQWLLINNWDSTDVNRDVLFCK